VIGTTLPSSEIAANVGNRAPRTEEERAEASFLWSDEDGGGSRSAIREQLPKMRRGSRHRPTSRRTVKMRNANERSAWEAMHAPSLDVLRTGAAQCRSSIPASHVTVGPARIAYGPQEGQTCVFFIKPSHLRH
jgi:hypothetical protein